ncbi:MAG: DUF4347 domain-containing protein, partial [Okeania sp. SIO2D1]|nr:DUF4347 domain-containing protein [Okeania sp. SIO2D1]
MLHYRVDNYNHLISQIDSQTRVVILKPNQNGIDQISESLDECCDVDAVHIISHGAKGTLYLGDNILNSENIHLYVESIQQWGKCLSAEGEILIYGCQVASGKEGREFIRQLHQLTGANIAASETLTGNVSKGGNWNLEVIFGQLKSTLAFTPEVRASYAGVLADIVVNTTNDVVDDSDGVTSLREAIIEANSTPEDDTIQLTGGETYNLTISGSGENAAATGDLDIVAGGGEITVISEGEEQAVIDAGGESGINDRVFHVLEDAALELENVEITGGFLLNGNGGGINNSGTVGISNSTISGNFGNTGGGINNTGTVNVNDSSMGANIATIGGGIGNYSSGIVNINNNSIIALNIAPNGGGIFNSSTLNVNDSTISSNGGIYGGGIENTGTATISNSTVSGNLALSTETVENSAGGGILNVGSISINDSNISGNSSDFDGGGITIVSGTVNISDTTISENTAGLGGGIS